MKTGFFYGCSLLLAALSLMLTSCKTANKTGGKLMPDAEEATVLASEAAMPHVIVYKTSKDYSRNVPVVLDDSRSVIVSYPAPTDVTPSVFLPVSLDKGYWLDRKGISENTAFLSYTYEEYARMESAPDMDTLLKAVAKNWEGEEKLRQFIVNRTPFFGNDDPYADSIAVKVYDDLVDAV